jgi:hypothetical protein
VIQVVKMVVASAVNENGEEVHPRTWNHQFMELPEVKNQWPPAHSSETMIAIATNSKGPEQMLYVLLGHLVCGLVKRSDFRSISTSRTIVPHC